jgi:hypothetical protein
MSETDRKVPRCAICGATSVRDCPYQDGPCVNLMPFSIPGIRPERRENDDVDVG